MNTRNLFFIGLIVVCPIALAGQAKVTWESPEKYADVRAAEEHRQRFQQRVFQQLEQEFQKLADTLPQSQTWQITVTNLDLAGEVRHQMLRNGRSVRVVKDLYYPSISFRYQLIDGNQIIQEKTVKLRDLGFLHRAGRQQYSRQLVGDEAQMIRNWFAKNMKHSSNGY